MKPRHRVDNDYANEKASSSAAINLNDTEAKYLEIRWMPMRCFLAASCSMDRSVPRDWLADCPASSTSGCKHKSNSVPLSWLHRVDSRLFTFNINPSIRSGGLDFSLAIVQLINELARLDSDSIRFDGWLMKRIEIQLLVISVGCDGGSPRPEALGARAQIRADTVAVTGEYGRIGSGRRCRSQRRVAHIARLHVDGHRRGCFAASATGRRRWCRTGQSRVAEQGEWVGPVAIITFSQLADLFSIQWQITIKSWSKFEYKPQSRFKLQLWLKLESKLESKQKSEMKFKLKLLS